MNKRKASEDQRERPEKKNKREQEERGLKRSADDDWEIFAKKLMADAERRAEENKKAGVGVDMDNDMTMREIERLGPLSQT